MNSCPTCGDQFENDVAFCPKDGAPLQPARGEVDLVGTIVADRYRITSRIGGGGMGQVFKAEHIRMKRQCAIKVLRGNLLGDPDAVQRFQREAENASQLSHPNVAQIYDFGEHDGDGVPGDGVHRGRVARRPAASASRRCTPTWRRTSSRSRPRHSKPPTSAGVLHRDVKPDNIMLAKHADGTYLVKLVDFGIARAMTSDDQRVTRTGLVIGTPEFMSPEQLAGEELDARSDQYALGLVAFQCLTGKDAFPNTSSKQNLIMRLTSRPRTLAEVRDDVPWSASLQTVFDRALAPDLHERYETISAFAEELANAISEMTPTETAELYRKALDRRVVKLPTRAATSNGGTPASGTAASGSPTAATTGPMPAAGTAATADAAAASPTGPMAAAGGQVPGTYPPGAYPPGAYPPGAYPPGAYPPGAYQTGAYPPGAYPPGAYPPGTYAPGQYPPGAYAPGAYPTPTGQRTPPYQTPITRPTVDALPVFRRRARVMPWVLLVAAVGWGYIVYTGRTGEAKAAFRLASSSKVTSLIESGGASAGVVRRGLVSGRRYRPAQAARRARA